LLSLNEAKAAASPLPSFKFMRMAQGGIIFSFCG
jgi:hypothetical protein